MSKRKWLFVAVVGTLTAIGASIAAAAEFGEGEYTLEVPAAGEFSYSIASGEITGISAPEGYELDDDDPEEESWKAESGDEVEAKLDKVEGDTDWSDPVTLTLPDGGAITIQPPDGDGNFEVTTSGSWWAFGDGKDWFVANDPDIGSATAFFKVEAGDDGFEVIAVDEADEGFLNDLDDEEDEEFEALEDEEDEVEALEDEEDEDEDDEEENDD